MAYVTTDMHTNGQQNLEQRLSLTENRSNQLFSDADKKLSETAQELNTMEIQLPQIGSEIEIMKTDVQMQSGH